jgi:hypothetical protein
LEILPTGSLAVSIGSVSDVVFSRGEFSVFVGSPSSDSAASPEVVSDVSGLVSVVVLSIGELTVSVGSLSPDSAAWLEVVSAVSRSVSDAVPSAGSLSGMVIEMVIVSEFDKPLVSVTEAVIVCVPTDRAEEEKEPPEPIEPSRFEVQLRLPVRSPSSASIAEPEKFTVVSCS